MMTMLIGREHERQRLLDYYRSDKAELVAVYGRRRVGKTYLIKETFSNGFFFSFTGTTHIKTAKGQLERFAQALHLAGGMPQGKRRIRNWNDAFDLLTAHIKAAGPTERKVIFFDEVPWLDTPRSGFLGAFEFFWNAFASSRNDILFIICGSSASWISKKLFKDHGGLHNRVTGRIALKPFTLYECEAYLSARGGGLQRYDIIECYMVFGGIPYYLDYLDCRYSLSTNIDRVFFAEDAPLKDEFEELFSSLFNSSALYVAAVTALSTRKKGLTRDELVKSIGYPDGSGVTDVLNNLELSGFIRRYNAYPGKQKGSLYQLIDNFSLFWLAFMRNPKPTDPHFWSERRNTPQLNAWRGYAFEIVCLRHLDQIKQGLGISGVMTCVSSWRSTSSKPGAQIDLVIERDDRVINLCEMKFSTSDFEIDGAYEKNLRNKAAAFIAETGTKKTVFLTMITTYGLTRNRYSGIIRSSVNMDALFVPSPD
jgi:AAA+ ATPase superfamily predicted ATPase